MDFERSFKQAVAFQSSGRFQDADRIYQTLSVDNNNAELFYNWAVVLYRLNKLDDAVNILRKAIKIQPGNGKAYLDLGRLLIESNKLDDAVIAIEKAVDLLDGDIESISMLGSLLVSLKRYGQAIPVYEAIKKHHEGSPEAWANLGNIYFLANQVHEAIDAFRHALSLQQNYAYAQQSLGTCLLTVGQFDECIEVLSSMKPCSPVALSTLGAAYNHKGDFDRAIEFYKQSVNILPDAKTYINLGNLYQNQTLLVLAEDAFRNAVLTDPGNIETYVSLSFLLERTGQLDAASDVITDGMKIDEYDPYLLLASATIKRRCKQYESAICDLDKLLNLDKSHERVRLALDMTSLNNQEHGGYIEPAIYYELGACYDRLNNTSEAYNAFSRANALRQLTPISQKYSKETFWSEIEELLSITPEVKSSVDDNEKLTSDAQPDPVFIVGFPRSGTTLTGNILDSHPSIQVLDEELLLNPVQDILAGLPDGYPHSLKSITSKQLKSLRGAYYTAVDKLIEHQPESILVDKLPLNLVKIVTLWRLFPNAKFVLILRHPCDVCLSCFMQNFSPNGAMNNFYTLEDAAALYNETMNAWSYYTENLPINSYQIRYEDILENFDDEISRLLNFIGVPWNDSVKAFDKHARDKESIATPSYHQVTQPLYMHSQYRWHKYHDEMTGIVELLTPHIEKYGYSSKVKVT